MFTLAKTNFFVIVFLLFTLNFELKAQTPSTCFEIQSILVDACGPDEGENEMVRFIVGPTNLNVNNLSVNWPANSFLSICKNATTASKVATINSTITGCGLLKEPTANILPAGARVILFTSTNFNVALNSFAGLTDTLYAIFQCGGNIPGHFANFGSGTRTLSMSFSSPGGCSDAVTYNKALLVDQSGTSVSADGATVNFAWNGNTTYTNYGCVAPIEIKTIDINQSSFSICPGDTINLSATIVGNFSSTTWSGGNGSFSSTNNSTTNYYSNITDNANFYIYIEGQTTCGTPLKDSVLVQIGGNNSSVTISSTSTVLCNGDSILLTANGTGNYFWNNSSSASSIYVSSAGTYTVSSNSACGNSSDTIIITTSPTINLNLTTNNSTICSGNTAILTASGATNYTWFNGNTGMNETVNSTGNYYVIGYNDCYRDSQSVSISVVTQPNVSISNSSTSTVLCSGQTITLTASGGNNYLWNTNDTSISIIISTLGTYSVTSTSSCGNSTANITITDSPTINLTLTTPNTTLCNGNAAILTANGAPNYTWFNGTIGTNVTVNSAGNYYVIGYNNCYRDSQSVTISVVLPPTLTISSTSSTNIICSGETITLTANGSNNYLWNTTDTTSSITITNAGTYTVTTNNLCGTFSTPILVANGIFPVATILGDSIICNNNGITLTATGGNSYLWSNASTLSSTNFNNAQQIYAIAINSCGSDTAYKTIYDYSLTASFTSNFVPDNHTPIEIIFGNTSSNSLSYHWDFGDGITDTLESPIHVFTSNGEYTVVLTSSNQYCSKSYETTLLFYSPNSVFIPNVFTPNDDNINDVFSIIGENIAKIECQIFNRWGEKLYSWNTIDGFWDGTYKNSLVPDGTYFYMARIVWSSNDVETFTGHVSILR